MLDSNVEVVGNLDEFIDQNHGNNDISMPPHPDCGSYLEEVEKIRQIRNECGKEIETDENMEETIEKLMMRGFKFDTGYHETTLSIRSKYKAHKGV